MKDTRRQEQIVDKVQTFGHMYSPQVHRMDTPFEPESPGRRAPQAAFAAFVGPRPRNHSIDGTGACRIEYNQLIPCQACDPFWNLALNYLDSSLSRAASAASLV